MKYLLIKIIKKIKKYKRDYRIVVMGFLNEI